MTQVVPFEIFSPHDGSLDAILRLTVNTIHGCMCTLWTTMRPSWPSLASAEPPSILDQAKENDQL